MRFFWTGYILVLACALCIFGVSASGCDTEWTVHPAFPNGSNPASGSDSGNLVLPGMTGPLSLWHSQFYEENIPSGRSRYWIDLAWAPVSDPYTLSVYSPDAVLGPYANSADGIVDGRIFLEISGNSTLTPGTWYYQVRGNGSPPPAGYLFQTWHMTDPKGT